MCHSGVINGAGEYIMRIMGMGNICHPTLDICCRPNIGGPLEFEWKLVDSNSGSNFFDSKTNSHAWQA